VEQARKAQRFALPQDAAVVHTRQPTAFGEKFRQWMAKAGTNTAAFAAANGLNQRTLHGWVREGRRPSPHGLAVIAAATGIPADYWIDDSQPWPPASEYLKASGRTIADISRNATLDEIELLLDLCALPRGLARTKAFAVLAAALGRPRN
jgi:transcriptional regulator with XRE-family HTH domain